MIGNQPAQGRQMGQTGDLLAMPTAIDSDSRGLLARIVEVHSAQAAAYTSASWLGRLKLSMQHPGNQIDVEDLAGAPIGSPAYRQVESILLELERQGLVHLGREGFLGGKGIYGEATVHIVSVVPTGA